METGNDRRLLTRRAMLQLTAAGAAAGMDLPRAFAVSVNADAAAQSAEKRLYSDLLLSWCDGLVAHQITAMSDPVFYGGFLCPSCALIHGRCGDAVYPLLWAAHHTGEEKYLRAAKLVHEWSQLRVSRPDGSWVNDVTLSTWQGITVFHSIALAEALLHHGEVLDAATRAAWTDRLARAAKFLDGFITIETGNVNYPVTATQAFVLCGKVLGDSHLVERGRRLGQEVLAQFTPEELLCGEGHPLQGASPKGCRPVDLGYNVEESLPALAQYSLYANDGLVRAQVVSALQAHMEFLLPDGGWDNSWGTRNYKWTYWGSRTSDGCQPGYVLMAKYDPRFREVARRNTELMAASTHKGLLYGGPDYAVHGDLPCIHHTFTHAKALATVLDCGDFSAGAARLALPRDEPYGLKTFPAVGAYLAAVGPWRATVTEYDWEYVEHGQKSGGGHVTGGALSMLYHMRLGPVLSASMTQYEMIEPANQQQFISKPHMPLTPRIECAFLTSLNDFGASLQTGKTPGGILFEARGRMMTNAHKTPAGGDLHYCLTYCILEDKVELTARVDGETSDPFRLIVPVISRSGETVERTGKQKIGIAKTSGRIAVSTDAALGFEPVADERTFDLVPGFEALPLAVPMQPGVVVRVTIEADAAK
ncbi:MAG: hypothetical protein P4K83_02700 [Terracidiphilus sp.]|nr:hypothetical protein [Terracidiphilus sp.]